LDKGGRKAKMVEYSLVVGFEKKSPLVGKDKGFKNTQTREIRFGKRHKKKIQLIAAPSGEANKLPFFILLIVVMLIITRRNVVHPSLVG
jgi:hypothetical protein